MMAPFQYSQAVPVEWFEQVAQWLVASPEGGCACWQLVLIVKRRSAENV